MNDSTIIENGQTTLVRANANFMWRHPLHVIAQGFGSGLSPLMPGTVGTLFGWLVFNLATQRWPVLLTLPVASALLVACFVLGVWACQITGRNLGAPDHGSMVWDEMVAMWLVLLLLPNTWGWQLSGFLLFRLFDMSKPPPIRQFERAFKNGFGVMADDILAAFFALLVLALVKALWL